MSLVPDDESPNKTLNPLDSHVRHAGQTRVNVALGADCERRRL